MWRDFFKPKNENWRWAFCFALPTYLFLFVTAVEPFKNDKITYVWASTDAYISHSVLSFLLVTIIAILITIIIPKYFPKYFLPNNFIFQRFFTLILLGALLIETCYFFTNQYYFHFDITLLWLVTFMTRVTISSFLFAGVPFVFGFLQISGYFNGLHKNDKEEVKFTHSEGVEPIIYEKNNAPIDEKRTPQYKIDLAPKMLHFSDNSNRKSLEIPLDRFYYITSAQNYIEVFYEDKNAVTTRQILRNSLKAIEEDMILNDENSPLIRCHKAFIVNREKVIELRGPAKTAHFVLDGIDASIPVSRQKYAELGEQFSTPNNNFHAN